MNVTGRIDRIKQPYGGYLKPSNFKRTIINDGKELFPEENIHATIVGMVVDYLTRYVMGCSIKKSFYISLMGAARAEKLGFEDARVHAAYLATEIKRTLDDDSIINACKLVSFDIWLRNRIQAPLAPTFRDINPDKETISNIRTMIERSVNFFDTYGPIVEDGFGFTPKGATEDEANEFITKCAKGQKATFGGYTNTINSGDGDFLTSDTLWDFKVSKNRPTSKNTLQLLVYLIMGIHSGREEFQNISKLGIFNPRLNTVYLYDVFDISDEVVTEVEDIVIGY